MFEAEQFKPQLCWIELCLLPSNAILSNKYWGLNYFKQQTNSYQIDGSMYNAFDVVKCVNFMLIFKLSNMENAAGNEKMYSV